MTELGIIEGYFGRSWSMTERRAVVDRLAPSGYRFFHYAPKFDAKLRRQWQSPYDASELDDLANFAAYCRAANMRFGIGLTPFGAHLDFSTGCKAALRAKVAQLDAIGIDQMAILFDDMDGDLPDLAQRQVDIAGFIMDCSLAKSFFLCPSYYSDDPLLDRVFGPRPKDYLEDLGRLLDSDVAIYWTGEEVCSREYSVGHLRDVADRLGRKPALWDNYPVNDGPRMSQYLHLRAFTGRSAEIGKEVSHHAINPASQPVLGCIPALTLPMAYAQGPNYRYGEAFTDAAATMCGPELAAQLVKHLLLFNDSGLERIGDDTKSRLRDIYGSFDHPAAHEIVDWLDEGYAITGEMLQTQ